MGFLIGGYLGVIIIIYGFVLIGLSKGLIIDLINVLFYSLLGMVLLICLCILNDKLLFCLFCN